MPPNERNNPEAGRRLPSDPAAAMELIRSVSDHAVVLVFKKSPTCPISHAAEREFRSFLERVPPSPKLVVFEIDVLAERPLARGLTAALSVTHESPQALCFAKGSLLWHESHGELTLSAFEREWRAASASLRS